MDPIYLDYNATTPTAPEVAEAMAPYLSEHFGNPSSGHAWGQRTHKAVEKARGQVAQLLQASPNQIVFTSGGTEANNHAIIGAARHAGNRGHVVISAIEHPAVSAVCNHLASIGIETTAVGVDEKGKVDPQEVGAALRPDTFLVSVMLANNEVGTLQPVAEIAAIAHAKGILCHSDCAQAVGKIPVSLPDLGVDMISLASHKLYGPKGSGALVLADGITLPNLMFGANHENGRRPGTENVLGIVGLGAACELVGIDLPAEMNHLVELRDQLATSLTAAHPEVRLNGHPTDRLPNTLSLSYPGRLAGEILGNLAGVAVSAGAACHSEGVHISHVLTAMNVPREFALGTLRLSLGRMTTADDITTAASRIARAVDATLHSA